MGGFCSFACGIFTIISSLIGIIKTSFRPKFRISILIQSGDTSPQILYIQVGKSVGLFRNCEFEIENFSFWNFEFGIFDCNRNRHIKTELFKVQNPNFSAEAKQCFKFTQLFIKQCDQFL